MATAAPPKSRAKCEQCNAPVDQYARYLPPPASGGYQLPSLTVDAAVLRPNNGSFDILLIRRGHPPFKGHWAFPGGFVEYNEDPTDGVLRELMEETSITPTTKPRLVAVHGHPLRDPRKHVVTIMYFMLCDKDAAPAAGDDAANAEFRPLKELLDSLGTPGFEMAFDHGDLLKELNEWLHKEGIFGTTE